ncbi:TetR/AcrR family transcriptional regulator [Mycobacterium sp. SMC-11]|uniref:TetR/AcrR family transcriptional regulator n=1 Tax=Mycobacterium sp. SMC-11 TaxID=3385969 RepID=UPI00390CB29B
MSRLSRADSAARTRQLLLEAAEAVFAERGFANASLSEIGERAGFSRGALYANFANKTELFLALLDRWLGAEIAEHREIISSGTTVQHDIDALRGGGGNRFADKQRHLLLTEFRLYALRHPEAADRLQEYDRVSRLWFARSVMDAFARAKLTPPVSPNDIALLALALEHGIATLAHTDPQAISQDSFSDMLTLLTRGLTAVALQPDKS